MNRRSFISKKKLIFIYPLTDKICYFQFVCSVQESGVIPTPLKLKQVMYIRPNLKVFEALFKLKNSPLLKYILHPKLNCEKPKKQRFSYKGYVSVLSSHLFSPARNTNRKYIRLAEQTQPRSNDYAEHGVQKMHSRTPIHFSHRRTARNGYVHSEELLLKFLILI